MSNPIRDALACYKAGFLKTWKSRIFQIAGVVAVSAVMVQCGGDEPNKATPHLIETANTSKQISLPSSSQLASESPSQESISNDWEGLKFEEVKRSNDAGGGKKRHLFYYALRDSNQVTTHAVRSLLDHLLNRESTRILSEGRQSEPHLKLWLAVSVYSSKEMVEDSFDQSLGYATAFVDTSEHKIILHDLNVIAHDLVPKETLGFSGDELKAIYRSLVAVDYFVPEYQRLIMYGQPPHRYHSRELLRNKFRMRVSRFRQTSLENLGRVTSMGSQHNWSMQISDDDADCFSGMLGVFDSATGAMSIAYDNEWYRRPVLLNATVVEWNRANIRDKIATAGEWLNATSWKGRVRSPGDYRLLYDASEKLVDDLDSVIPWDTTSTALMREKHAELIRTPR